MRDKDRSLKDRREASKGGFSTLQPVQLLRAILYDMAALLAFVAAWAGIVGCVCRGVGFEARKAHGFGSGGNMKLAT